MKTKFLSIYLFIILIITFSGSSYCQEGSRANIHYKNLKLILDGMYSQGFTDNVALTPTSLEEGGAKTNLRAMVGFLLPIKKNETDLKFFTNLVLNGDPTYDVKSFSVLIVEKIKLGQYINILSDGSLTRAISFNPISDLLPVDILSGKFRCTAAIKSKKRLSFVSTYSFTYEDNRSGDDYQENSTLNSVWFSFTPKTALLVCYNFTKGHYLPSIPSNDNETYSHVVRTGIRFAKILKRLDGQLGFGIQHSKSTLYEAPDTESDGPGFNFRFGQYPIFADIEGRINSNFPKVKARLDINCGIRPTFGTNRIYAYQDTTSEATENLVYLSNPFVSILGSKLTCSWNVVFKFFINASLAGENRNFPVGSRHDTYIKQTYSLEWRDIRKYFQFGISYNRTSNKSNVSRYNYVVNEPGLMLSAKF